MVNNKKKKNQHWNSYILPLVYEWLAAILFAWEVSDRVRTRFQAKNSRTFQDPTLKFQGLFICVESYVLRINTWTCRNARQRELENTCKPDIRCAFVAQWTCVRVRREHKEHKTSVFAHFVSTSRTVYHLFSLPFIYFKTCKCLHFRSRPIKNEVLSRTTNFKYFQGPWNRTAEFKWSLKTRMNPELKILE